MTSFPSWECPFCGQTATVTGKTYSRGEHEFGHGNKGGPFAVVIEVVECPNRNCSEYSIQANLCGSNYDKFGAGIDYDNPLDHWILRPRPQTRAFPSYIPEPIRRDYEEACLIQNLSPKASATLARRCLQGMIRDFWDIRKDRLFDEIAELRENVDAKTWEAIDAVRKVGNIGAHMEKDVNTIIEVDPEEAALLIGLIEILLKEWYIARHDKEEYLQSIIDVADGKTKAKRDLATKEENQTY